MESSLTYHIIAFIIITLIVFAIIVTVYYIWQLRNGKSLTMSQINTILVFLVIVGILAFIMWLSLIYSMFTGHNDEDHHSHVIRSHVHSSGMANPEMNMASHPMHNVHTFHTVPQQAAQNMAFSPASYPVAQAPAPTAVSSQFVPAGQSMQSSPQTSNFVAPAPQPIQNAFVATRQNMQTRPFQSSTTNRVPYTYDQGQRIVSNVVSA